MAGAIAAGASAVYIHGGHMDYLYAQDQLDIVPDILQQIRAAGLAAGVAGHNPEVHRWANENLALDFHMCSYYDPSPRDDDAEHHAEAHEVFSDDDRNAMVQVIRELRAPVIHYKTMAAGRKPPEEAFAFVAEHLRSRDAVCIGIFPKEVRNMLAEDIQLFESKLHQ